MTACHKLRPLPQTYPRPRPIRDGRSDPSPVMERHHSLRTRAHTHTHTGMMVFLHVILVLFCLCVVKGGEKTVILMQMSAHVHAALSDPVIWRRDECYFHVMCFTSTDLSLMKVKNAVVYGESYADRTAIFSSYSVA